MNVLGTYYNDLIKPKDPYEFINLLRSEDLLARQKNRQLEYLGQMLFMTEP